MQMSVYCRGRNERMRWGDRKATKEVGEKGGKERKMWKIRLRKRKVKEKEPGKDCTVRTVTICLPDFNNLPPKHLNKLQCR